MTLHKLLIEILVLWSVNYKLLSAIPTPCQANLATRVFRWWKVETY